MEFFLFCQIFCDFMSKLSCQMSKNHLKFKKSSENQSYFLSNF
jgi:hypothetical protein